MENCFNRFLADYQIAKWNFYRGYALVKRIFNSKKIDLVIVKGFNHGYAWDRLLTDFATYKKINNYNVEDMLYNTRTVYNNYKQSLVEVNNDYKLDIKASLFYKEEYDGKRFGTDIWSWIYKLGYHFFGSLGVDAIKCIRYKDLGEDRMGVTILERIAQYKKIVKMKKFASAVSEKLDVQRKYICYMLHFEPEATVAGRSLMDSQIVAINMIASNLPKDWILYVKEHPSQYMVNRTNFYNYLYGVAVFKTKRFYKEISSIKNVRLLRSDISNKLVIQNCQAMATLSGTVAAEAVTFGKPVMVFSPERTIYSLSKGFYKIYSFEDCREAVKKIIGHEAIDYSDFNDVCQKYLIDFSDEKYGFKKAVESIKHDIMK